MNPFTLEKPWPECRIDLHCHSTVSDGTLSIEELLMRASNQQIDLLALTDHDSIEGVAEAMRLGLQQKPVVHVVSGVEISCAWEGMEIHVLGLHFDLTNETLNHLLDAQAARRSLRAKTIAAILQAKGLEDAWGKVKRLANDSLVTRAHFARLLVQEKWVSSEKTAFKKYLRKGRKAYVSPPWCSIEEAVAAIHGAGGVSVLAHPLDYQFSDVWLNQLFSAFVAAGGAATEVAQCQQTPSQREKLSDLATKYHLLASQGSDFHFPGTRRELGRSLFLRDDLTPVWQQWQLAQANPALDLDGGTYP